MRARTIRFKSLSSGVRSLSPVTPTPAAGTTQLDQGSVTRRAAPPLWGKTPRQARNPQCGCRRRLPGRSDLQEPAHPRLRGETYRRDIKGIRNLQTGRHSLAAAIFHGKKGELYQRYHKGMQDQLGALGLVLNCVVLGNTF